MKKIIKLIIVSSILFVVGLFFIGISLGVALNFSAKNNAAGSKNNKLILSEYTIPLDEAEKIDVDLSASHVNICPTDESEIKISYWEDKNNPVFVVKTEENTVKIRNVNDVNFNFSVNMISLYDLTGNSKNEHEINIYIPKEYAGSLLALVESGGLDMNNLTFQEEISIRVNSGSISLADISCEDNITISSNSGGVRLSDIYTNETLSIDVISGGINGDYIRANFIDASVNSGGIRINHVEVLKGIATKSNSGGIHVGLVDSVEAYSITSHTNSGGNNLYGLNGNGEKTINATANSGGINYTFDVQ